DKQKSQSTLQCRHAYSPSHSPRETYLWCSSVPTTRRKHTTKTRESRTLSAADSSKRGLTLSREKGIIHLLEDMGLLPNEIPVESLSVYTPPRRFASAR